MAYRELELTLLSAQELKNVNLITRMDVYAVVSISGDPLTRQCTEPDSYGGRNPYWNATFRFAVPPTAAAAAAAGASLHVLLRAERFLGDRDVGEVVVPLSDILASASGAGPQPPLVASYQVRKLHRWEPRGVLNLSYRLGPVVAPVQERAPEKVPYTPVGVPPQPYYQHPSSVASPAPPPARPPAIRVGAEHDEAAQKSPVMAYPVGVPQQASHTPAKPDAYRQPPPPSPRPAAVHAAAPAPASAPPQSNTRSNGFGQAGPTHVYMGPHSQIIFGGGNPTTTAGGGPPTRTTSPARSIIGPGPAGNKGDGNWALRPHDTHRGSYAESMSVISPRRKEDHWRPSVLSQSHKDTEQQQAASSPVAATPSFSSRSGSGSFSSSSSPSSPHSSNNGFRSRREVISSPLPSSSPVIPNHALVSSSPLSSSSPMVSNHSPRSSPLPPSSPLVPNHSSMVPSLSAHHQRDP